MPGRQYKKKCLCLKTRLRLDLWQIIIIILMKYKNHFGTLVR